MSFHFIFSKSIRLPWWKSTYLCFVYVARGMLFLSNCYSTLLNAYDVNSRIIYHLLSFSSLYECLPFAFFLCPFLIRSVVANCCRILFVSHNPRHATLSHQLGDVWCWSEWYFVIHCNIYQIKSMKVDNETKRQTILIWYIYIYNHHTGLPNSATSLVYNGVVDLGEPVYRLQYPIYRRSIRLLYNHNNTTRHQTHRLVSSRLILSCLLCNELMNCVWIHGHFISFCYFFFSVFHTTGN